jgi:hypothetical protein
MYYRYCKMDAVRASREESLFWGKVVIRPFFLGQNAMPLVYVSDSAFRHACLPLLYPGLSQLSESRLCSCDMCQSRLT